MDTRAAMAQWEKYLRKGEKLIAAMRGDDTQAGQIMCLNPPAMQSKWQDSKFEDDLKKWHWKLHYQKVYYTCASSSYEYSTAFLGLKIDGTPCEDGGNVQGFTLHHGYAADKVQDLDKYTADDKEYLITGAENHGAMNRKDGVMFAKFLENPMHAANLNWGKLAKHPDQMPALSHISDLFWGVWFKDNPNPKNIRYFWAQMIINPTTEKLVKRILRTTENSLDYWPGHRFSADSDEGKVLIGCPNGESWAWFLASHKQQLGKKHIKEVLVLNADDKYSGDPPGPIDLVYVVEDA